VPRVNITSKEVEKVYQINFGGRNAKYYRIKESC